MSLWLTLLWYPAQTINVVCFSKPFSIFLIAQKRRQKIHFFFFTFAFRNNVPDILHPLIQCRTLLRTVIQLVLQELCLTLRNIFLVLQLVFQTGPEIHGDGTELDFHIDQLLRILQKDRHLYDQVQAAVAALLGILYIILALDQSNVIRRKKLSASS